MNLGFFFFFLIYSLYRFSSLVVYIGLNRDLRTPGVLFGRGTGSFGLC